MSERDGIAQALETLRSGLYIITSAYRRQLAGCTAAWVARASFNPPLLAVALSPERATWKIVEAGKRFGVNVLGHSGLELARKFGFESGHTDKKFVGVNYRLSDNGSPIFDQAVAWFDCRVTSAIPAGDHMLIVGEVLAAQVQRPEEPYVYVPESFYARLEETWAEAGGAA